jgi:hypothetical protein
MFILGPHKIRFIKEGGLLLAVFLWLNGIQVRDVEVFVDILAGKHVSHIRVVIAQNALPIDAAVQDYYCCSLRVVKAFRPRFSFVFLLFSVAFKALEARAIAGLNLRPKVLEFLE